MKQKLDIKNQRKKDLGNMYDINILDADLEFVNNFDTNLQMSLLCERRADDSEIAEPELRRGWFGNELSDTPGFEIGSKLWLLSQARLTQNTLNLAINYARESLQWLIDDRLVRDIDVEASISGNENIVFKIVLYITPSITQTKFLDLWFNTEAVINERSL